MTLTRDKIIPIALIAGIVLWVIDALLDSLFFEQGAFVNSLILDITPHELYFRSFFLVSFILFGVIMSRIIAKAEKDREHLRRATLKAALEEAKSKAIFAAMGDGISIQDTDFRVLYQNDIHKKYVGDHAGELCFHAYENKEQVCDGGPIAAAFRDGEIHRTERTLTRGEKVSFFEITASPLRDTDGNIIAGIEVVRDISLTRETEEELIRHREQLSELVEEKTGELSSVIDLLQGEITDRRSTEEVLRETERRYRELVNFMSSGVAVFEVIHEGSSFILKELNQAGERMDNISRDTSIGRDVAEVFPSLCDLGLRETLLRVWKTGTPEHRPFSRYHEGQIITWRENYVYRLPSGEIVFVYDDITEQKQMAERESKLLKELKTMFESFPVGIVYLDRDFRIISTNRFFNTLMGFDAGELQGELCYETVGEYVEDATRQGTEKICSFCEKMKSPGSRNPMVIERPYRDKFLRVTTIPELDDAGEVVRFMEIVEDITERKLAEAEAVRASHLAAIGELAAGVAHEINNPINGIMNYAQILFNRSAEGSEERTISSKVIKESDRIAAIVSNLLSFAKDNRHQRTYVKVNDILDDSLALVETQIRKDGITLILSISEGLPPVLVHSQQIEQVFLNLISNARYALNQKYSSVHDNKVLEISATLQQEGGRPFVSITFHDRGTGIPAELMGKIMNPFFSTKSGVHGTGLGLSISHGIISDHGGDLRIKSKDGAYTEVIIDLPAAGT